MKRLSYFVIAALFTSCVYNKEEALPVPASDIEIADSITYTNYAKAVIDNNCIACHSSGGTGQPPFLTNYTEVFGQKNRIQARVIDGSPTFMPTSGSLPQPILDTLQIWINQGALQ